MKPIVFVAMPFGKKKNLDTGIEFDFDNFYERVFKPLSQDNELNMDFVREDLVDTRGIIQKTMIEKLLLSEYVIADLSLANPNVYYELGIRHCARKYTTFLIFSDMQLKFDVAPLRAIPYKIEDGIITESEIYSLQKILKDKLLSAKSKIEDDSPVYELLPDLDIDFKLSEEATKSFKDRALWINKKNDEISDIKICCNAENYKESIEKVHSIALELKNCDGSNIAIWAQIISCLKDLGAYKYEIELLEKFPIDLFNNSLFFKQNYAFALNRLGNHIAAQRILKECLSQFGEDSETYGLLGRTYKDQYKETTDTTQKEAFLDQAIETYTKGFMHDMHNYYTGINAAQLLLLKNTQQSKVEMEDILTIIDYSLKVIPNNKKDFWSFATHINCLILRKKYQEAKSLLINLFKFNATKEMFETTNDDFKRTLEIHKNQTDTTILENIIKRIDDKIMTLTPIK